MGVFFLTRDFLAQNQVTFALHVALTSWVLWLHGLQQNGSDLVRSGVGKGHWLREEAAFWPQGKGWRSIRTGTASPSQRPVGERVCPRASPGCCGLTSGWRQQQCPRGSQKGRNYVGCLWFMERKGGGCERHLGRFAPGPGPRLTRVAANCYRRFASAVQLSLCGIKENIKIF